MNCEKPSNVVGYRELAKYGIRPTSLISASIVNVGNINAHNYRLKNNFLRNNSLSNMAIMEIDKQVSSAQPTSPLLEQSEQQTDQRVL